MRILIKLYAFVLTSSFLWASCSKTTKVKESEFLLKEGFQIETVIQEPHLINPVAMDFDNKGRIWTAELTGYMRDIDGTDEDYPDGLISFFKDNDKDGIADEKVVFIDELVLPRALKCYNGGILYAEPPNLWWVEVKDDDTAGERVLVDTMYTNGGNVEHMPNGLLYNIDNWIYNAKSDRRYQYKNGEWKVEATIYRGQWGITNDRTGRLFYNDNSNPLFGDHVLPNSFNNNEYLKRKQVYKGNITGSRKFYPYQATAVNRGYQKGVLMPDGKVSNFTSACGPLIFKGNTWGTEYEGDAFVCGPEANLIKRYKLQESGGKIKGTMTDTVSEFITSKEETFRPVNIYDGPDGNMYVVDMRKGVIQHRAFLTTYLIELVQQRRLDQQEDGGRIYRVSKEDYQYAHKDYSSYKEAEWLPLIYSKNYWERIKAQEYLVQNGNKFTADRIREMLSEKAESFGTIHSLWTLDGLDKLKPADLVSTFISNTDIDIVTTALTLTHSYLDVLTDADMKRIFKATEELNNETIDIQLAYLSGLSTRPPFEALWKKMALKKERTEIYDEAIMSGIEDISLPQNTLPDDDYYLSLHTLVKEIDENKINDQKQLPKLNFDDVTDPRTKGLFLYHQYCATCHGRDGKGIEAIAPPLYESPYLNGPSEHLVLIALQGMEGPLVMDSVHYEFNAAMPGIKNNPELTDKDVRDILLWIRNSFSSSHESFSEKLVSDLREKLKDREALLTQKEVDEWPTK